MSMCHLISQTVVAHLTVGWMDPTMCKGILVALGTTFIIKDDITVVAANKLSCYGKR